MVQLLRMHEAAAHARPSVSFQADKVSRPRVSAAGSSEEWTYFLSRWADYKEAVHLTGSDCVLQLLECCDEALRRDLTRASGGSLATKPEQDVLAAMRRLAVREENTMVARVALQNMIQNTDEPIRTFAARLRRQAAVCHFTIQCPNSACGRDISYQDEVIRDIIARGISDSDIQLELLGHQNQHMSLEETISFIEAKEAGKRSAQRLLQSQGVAAARSQYRRAKNPPAPPDQRRPPAATPAGACQYCGQEGHGTKAPHSVRATSCPAFGRQCRNCRRRDHFTEVCRQQKTAAVTGASAATRHEDSDFGVLCGIADHTAIPNPDSTHTDAASCSATLAHHMFDDESQRWRRQTSQPQPTVDLELSVDPADYSSLGVECPNRTTTITQRVIADTGCQSCLAGTNLLRRLGIAEDELVPTSMRMHAANGNHIELRGAVILRISGQSNGLRRETRQFVYITPSTTAVYLSRDACRDLGIIDSEFPSIGLVSTLTDDGPSTDRQPCSCPTRQPPPPMPTELPMEATEENTENLRKWLVDYYSSSTFNTCEHQPLTKMDGPPLRLMVDKDADPVACHKAIPVPLHWQAEVKEALDKDVQLGVIEPVPVGDPVTWCHRMVVVSKKNGQPRRCVDLQPLNRHAVRETHHTASPFHQARSVPSNTYKTVLDAWNGYHSVPLHPDDRHLTTFLTPWGRYRYRVAPQGYISSGDGYTRRYDEIIVSTGLSHGSYTKCVDDTLIWGDSITETFWRTVEWLDMCGRHGITLNADKFTFARQTVKFAGFEISPEAVRPCREFLRSIAEFPTPKNLTDVRAWFGVVNHVSYAFAMADVMLPFRELLKPGKFEWTEKHEKLFEDSKHVIIQEVTAGVQIFDKHRPTVLATDWSRTGVGFWLLQKHCACDSQTPMCCATGWKTTMVGSRFTTGAESRYAPIEGEALAVADALEKTRFFVLGCTNLTIVVDHKPLLKVLGDRSLADMPNARLRNLKEKTLRFKFTVRYVPGFKNRVPDATSRYPAGGAIGLTLRDDTTVDESGSIAVAAVSTLRSITWDRIREATASDPAMHQLLEMIEDGSVPPQREDMPEAIRAFHTIRDGLLYTSDGVVLYDQRVIVPPCLRGEVLSSLHSAHQGVGMMLARAAVSVYWPGITADIRSMRDRCGPCNRNAPSQPCAPPEDIHPPEYPFQQVCADFFTYMGQTYLVVVDRYSGWPVVERASGGSKGLIACLRRTFSTFGIADELTSDGGPEFTAQETEAFLEAWGVRHRLSSVAYPHANCRAEVGVKTIKRLIVGNTGNSGELDVDQFQRAVLTYRNAPDPSTKLSPAQCVFGRPVRDFIPIHPGQYLPHPTWRETLLAREEALRNRHMRAHERWSEHTKRLPPLKVGDTVRIQNQTGRYPKKWDKTGRIIEVGQHNQYVVRVDGSGRATLRNRQFLRRYSPVIPSRGARLDDLLDNLQRHRQIPPAQLPDASRTDTRPSSLTPAPPPEPPARPTDAPEMEPSPSSPTRPPSPAPVCTPRTPLRSPAPPHNQQRARPQTREVSNDSHSQHPPVLDIPSMPLSSPELHAPRRSGRRPAPKPAKYRDPNFVQ